MTFLSQLLRRKTINPSLKYLYLLNHLRDYLVDKFENVLGIPRKLSCVFSKPYMIVSQWNICQFQLEKEREKSKEE